jgi:dephospho-CoA kinase
VNEKKALERGMARDVLSHEEVLKIMRSQIPLKQKIQYVDKIIDNNGTFKEFAERINELIASLRRQRGTL